MYLLRFSLRDKTKFCGKVSGIKSYIGYLFNWDFISDGYISHSLFLNVLELERISMKKYLSIRKLTSDIYNEILQKRGQNSYMELEHFDLMVDMYIKSEELIAI